MQITWTAKNTETIIDYKFYKAIEQLAAKVLADVKQKNQQFSNISHERMVLLNFNNTNTILVALIPNPLVLKQLAYLWINSQRQVNSVSQE